MSKLVLIGGGGHCKSVLDVALRMNQFDDIVITDPDILSETQILGCSVIGNDDCLEQLRNNEYDYAFIAVGSVRINPLREKLANKVASLGFKFPIIQDPSAIIADSAIVGDGTFIGKNVVINSDAKIGKHCIINTGSIIEHECSVGDFSHISVGTILCGEVSVGANCLIGAGSTVIQCLNIGSNVVIGANSTILTDVGDNMSCYGIVKKNRGGYSLTSVNMRICDTSLLEVA